MNGQITLGSYSPSIELLRDVIKLKKQGPCDKYRYMIGLRHHDNLTHLIDHLINVIVSHMKNDILISISVSSKLHKEISQELFDICDYIRFCESSNVASAFVFENYIYYLEHITKNLVSYDY